MAATLSARAPDPLSWRAGNRRRRYVARMGAPRRRRTRLSLVAVMAAGGLVAGCAGTAPDAASPHRGPTTGSEQPPLEGTTWLLESSVGADPDATPVPALLSAQPRLVLDADGRATGTDGCSDLAGTWNTEPLRIRLTASTASGCNDPTVNALALGVRSALARVASHAVFRGILTLFSTSGAPLMTYSSGAPALAGTSWHVSALTTGSAGVQQITLEPPPTAEFGADGTLSGSAGCNTFGARWMAGGTRLDITQIGGTLRACVNADGTPTPASLVEQRYLDALKRTVTFRLSGRTVRLRDAAGVDLVSLDPDQP